MLERGGGRIINQVSGGAFTPGGVYSISKLALVSLTATLATELGPRGINVNAIAPGFVADDAGYGSLGKDDPIRAAILAAVPGRRKVRPTTSSAPSSCSRRRPATGSTARRSASTAAGS